MRHLTVALTAMCLLVATLFALPGCSDKASRPGDHCVAPLGACATPEAALLALKQAYRERASAALDSLLSADFIFELSPEDAGAPGMPDEWGRSTELAINDLLFDAELAQPMAVDFVIGPRVFDEAEQLWTITITNVDIGLHGTTPDHPTPKSYQVRAG